ncbi:MAG TPA: glycine zipper 2TM domain-containing protein [Aquabacterium sp.]|uniref:glycine zipper 2TM domain-containing protein n=1 Tax=Aquabacterium sp. TaxID=1872578 RepID=UPI002E37D1BB|nr:glycine zipper 2TM domain-containing protein [Aquabacterium sp.]HEX5371671.1 glycine zipper 2TM domain-containing protein [Aquabacterium sp.]
MLTSLTSSPLIRTAMLATACALGAPMGVHAVVVAGPSGTVPTTSLSTTATSSGSAATSSTSPAATTSTKAVAAAVVASSASTAKAAAVSPCTHCGTVQEVTARKKKGEGSGLGLIAGAVVGGVVGNQFGKGTGNTVTTVGGAVAGGVVGNEIEKNANKRTEYVTKIKMDDGTVREFKLEQQYAVGARVTVDGDKVQAKP